MKPQMQTTSEPGKGNCWSACIASILEIPLTDIPDFWDGDDDDSNEKWWLNARRYLDCYELMMLTTILEKHDDLGGGWDCYWIACGKSPRHNCKSHCVVYFADAMVHDPHPDGMGLEGRMRSASFLIPRDPARRLRQKREYVPLMDAEVSL